MLRPNDVDIMKGKTVDTLSKEWISWLLKYELNIDYYILAKKLLVAKINLELVFFVRVTLRAVSCVQLVVG